MIFKRMKQILLLGLMVTLVFAIPSLPNRTNAVTCNLPADSIDYNAVAPTVRTTTAHTGISLSLTTRCTNEAVIGVAVVWCNGGASCVANNALFESQSQFGAWYGFDGIYSTPYKYHTASRTYLIASFAAFLPTIVTNDNITITGGTFAANMTMDMFSIVGASATTTPSTGGSYDPNCHAGGALLLHAFAISMYCGDGFGSATTTLTEQWVPGGTAYAPAMLLAIPTFNQSGTISLGTGFTTVKSWKNDAGFSTFFTTLIEEKITSVTVDNTYQITSTLSNSANIADWFTWSIPLAGLPPPVYCPSSTTTAKGSALSTFLNFWPVWLFPLVLGGLFGMIGVFIGFIIGVTLGFTIGVIPVWVNVTLLLGLTLITIRKEI